MYWTVFSVETTTQRTCCRIGRNVNYVCLSLQPVYVAECSQYNYSHEDEVPLVISVVFSFRVAWAPQSWWCVKHGKWLSFFWVKTSEWDLSFDRPEGHINSIGRSENDVKGLRNNLCFVESLGSSSGKISTCEKGFLGNMRTSSEYRRPRREASFLLMLDRLHAKGVWCG